MPSATNIVEVLNQLDQIIDECIIDNNRLGLFAYIYRRTTAEIAHEISLGNFEDNERLEVLDVEFANLYLDAYDAHKKNQPLSASWKYAFEHAAEPLTIVQHIMMGMNAHINLDLAVATATVMTNKPIQEIESDYMKVNDILFQIVDEMQERLGRVSPLMFLVDWLGNNKDEKVIDFSMRKAREQSWNSANLLWSLVNRSNAINNIDSAVLELSKKIKKPKAKIIQFVLKVMSRFETKEVSWIIKKLKE